MQTEGSANSARSTENSPVIPAGEGEGELTLDTESPPIAKGTRNTKVPDGICKANSDDCNFKKKTSKKPAAKKLLKKKTVNPDEVQ